MIGEDGSLSPLRDSVNGSIGHSAHAEALRNALNEAVSSQKHCQGWTSSSEDEAADPMKQAEDFAKIRHGMSFNDRKREHYDEFWRVKELKKKGCLLENENDEDDDAGRGRYDSSSSFSDGVREIHIEGDDESHRTIVIHGDAESLPQRQILPCSNT
ncbi:protein phosphatase inhibitor 2-like isoform X2 [Corylus avellana]|nr:protein phosphatase inhibitor 2-like isoform X2 [Corylus avellana]